jgi:hypothetical protein
MMDDYKGFEIFAFIDEAALINHEPEWYGNARINWRLPGYDEDDPDSVEFKTNDQTSPEAVEARLKAMIDRWERGK